MLCSGRGFLLWVSASSLRQQEVRSVRKTPALCEAISLGLIYIESENTHIVGAQRLSHAKVSRVVYTSANVGDSTHFINRPRGIQYATSRHTHFKIYDEGEYL